MCRPRAKGRVTATSIALTIFLFLATLRGAVAAAGSLSIVVGVRDASSGAGVPHVHVTLESDSRTYDGFTDKTGYLRFSGIVPDGYVVMLEQQDYDFGLASFIHLTSNGARYAFFGKRTTLRQIGNVLSQAHTASVAARSRSEDQIGSQLSGSVLGNPYNVPNLTIGAGGSLQVGGQGQTTTTTTIGGAPFFPSGFRIPAALLQSDIFSSASTSAIAAGAPGGILALEPFEPTLDWQALVLERPSSYGGNEFAVRARGTEGSLGISFSHAEDVDASPLNDTTFVDTRGMSYTHDVASVTSGDLLTLRLPVSSDSVLRFTAGNTLLFTPATCSLSEGAIPCAYGPSAEQRDSLEFGTLSDEVILNRATIKSQVFASRSNFSTNDGTQFALGMSDGANDLIQTSVIGTQLSSQVLISNGRYASLSVQATRDTSVLEGAIGLPNAVVPASSTSLLSSTLDVPIVASRRTKMNAKIGYENEDALSRVSFGANGSYAIDNQQRLNISGTSGLLGTPAFGSSIAATPIADLEFDCAGHALGFGSSTASGPPIVDRAQVEYSYARGPITASLAYDSIVDSNYAITGAIVPDADAGLYPASYFSEAAAAAGTLCGTPQPIVATKLYLSGTIQVPKMIENRLTADFSTSFGPRLSFRGYYTLDQARPFGLAPQSVAINVRNGSQIPYVPFYLGNASLAYALSGASSLIAQATAFGGMNQYSKAAFASVDFGAKITVERGDLLAVVRNVGNVAAPLFERFSPFPFLPQPYPARSYSLTYRLPIGNSFVDRNQLLNPPVASTDTNTVIFEPIAFEGANHADFLAPNTEASQCGPESRARALEILSDIRKYIAIVQQSGTTGATEVSMDGIRFDRMSSAAGYTIRITFPNSFRAIAPIMRCGRLHEGDVNEAEKLGIYIPDARTRYSDGVFTLYYAPQAGLYFPPEAIDQTYADLPSTSAPRFPSGIPIERVTIDERSCPSSYRGVVGDILKDLRRTIPEAYGGPDTSTSGSDFSIGRHPARGGPWLEIAFRDGDLVNAVASCLRVPVANDEQLRRVGLGGSDSLQSINYASSVGFYRLVNF
jgi:hypothetical protein